VAECPALSFTFVSAEAWAAMKAEVETEYGIAVEADEGEQAADGFTIKWFYADKYLVLQCTGSPFLVPCSVINGTITDMVKQVMAAHP
jgi:hypothetical protein